MGAHRGSRHRRGWGWQAVAGIGLLVLGAIIVVIWIPTRPPPSSLFTGAHGYKFRLTAATAGQYRISSTFRDKERRSEVVFIHPRGIPPEVVFRTPESAYAEKSVIRMEVNLNSLYPSEAQPKLLDAFLYAATKTLKERGEPFNIGRLEGANLPGFAVEIGGTHPITQVFLKGNEIHYLLTSDPNNPIPHEVLSSLEDAQNPDGK